MALVTRYEKTFGMFDKAKDLLNSHFALFKPYCSHIKRPVDGSEAGNRIIANNGKSWTVWVGPDAYALHFNESAHN